MVSEKLPILVLSYHEPDSCGGFEWSTDTPSERDIFVRAARVEADSYRDVIVVAAKVVYDGSPSALTELLDEELVFESGRVGEILFRSEAWEDA